MFLVLVCLACCLSAAATSLARPHTLLHDACLPTGAGIRAALDATLRGVPAPKTRPSIGCNIKWTPGKEPDYYGAQIVKK